MKITRPGIMIVALCTTLFTGCVVSESATDNRYSAFAKKNAALIKEMAEYAVLFCRENKVNNFASEQIADRKTRRKMGSLGREVAVFYCCTGDMIDSTVTFKSITIFHGVLEYIYDFAAQPRNAQNDTADINNVRIQVDTRVYYTRRPFPWM
jgi:hypothetical protein